jgi:uncharacterized protein YndB with AHSA1/START domain
MPTVRVTRTIRAPIEDVFNLLTDHANYEQFRGIRASKLLREGQPERNGVGAMRMIDVGPVRFEEEITAFERPTRMDYVIRRINLPFEHEGGTMRFEAIDGGTRVEWVTTFRFTVPAIGGLLGGAGTPLVRLGFISMLREAEAKLSPA